MNTEMTKTDSKGKRITLKKHEKIIAVVPEYCHGPGWSNNLVCVHIVDYSTSKHRVEYLQPDEQSTDMHKNFMLLSCAHNMAINSVWVKTNET